MDERKRSFAKERDYRIAAGLFESALEACKRLSSEDQQSLLTIEKVWAEEIKDSNGKPLNITSAMAQ
jgi:hypothetical protein